MPPPATGRSAGMGLMQGVATLFLATVGGSAVLLGLLCGRRMGPVPDGTPSVAGLATGLVAAGSLVVASVVLMVARSG